MERQGRSPSHPLQRRPTERCSLSLLPAPGPKSDLHHASHLEECLPWRAYATAQCCRMLKCQWRRGTTRLHLATQKQCKLHGMLPEQTAAFLSRYGPANTISLMLWSTLLQRGLGQQLAAIVLGQCDGSVIWLCPEKGLPCTSTLCCQVLFTPACWYCRETDRENGRDEDRRSRSRDGRSPSRDSRRSVLSADCFLLRQAACDTLRFRDGSSFTSSGSLGILLPDWQAHPEGGLCGRVLWRKQLRSDHRLQHTRFHQQPERPLQLH